MEGLEGTPLGVVRVCSRPFGASPVATVPPSRCLRTFPPIRNVVVVHLAQESLTTRFLHDGGTYWKQSKRVFTGEGL